MFGPYRLQELIGRGGMGEIYRAYDTARGRIVALKRLPAALAADPVFQARFRSEAALAARLHEPHVIPIHDFGEIDGQLYIDMRMSRDPTWPPFWTAAHCRRAGWSTSSPRSPRSGRRARRRAGSPRPPF
jgi:serine/threonine protein kinase